MSQLIIRGARIREFKAYPGAQRTVDVKMSAPWNETVCAEMGWEFKPQGFEGGNLEGKLLGVNLILEPGKKELDAYRLDVPISEVCDFKLKSKKDGEGNIGNRELEFTVVTAAAEAVSLLDNWMTHLGEDIGQCKIVFNADEQPSLDLGEEPAKPRGRRKAEKEETAAVQ
jgi:hypothetical protein